MENWRPIIPRSPAKTGQFWSLSRRWAQVASLLAFGGSIVLPLEVRAAGLTITPSNIVLATGENGWANAVGESGRPVQDAKWSLSAPVADLRPGDGDIWLQGQRSGRAILTATVGGSSATAVITVLAGSKLPDTTVRWSLDPTAGYETLEVRQAEPVSDVDLYSIEWRKSSDTVLRALRFTGEQLWMVHLPVRASPESLNERMDTLDGATSLGSKRLANMGQMILGDGGTAYSVRSHNPALEARVPVGQEILVRDSADGFGGLLMFERGHTSDSMVDFSAEDGHEAWRYRSPGRLDETWTVNHSGDIGIVENILDPPSSAFLVLSGNAGEVLYRVPFPKSSSTMRISNALRGIISGSHELRTRVQL